MQIPRKKTITITLISLQFLLLASIFISPVVGNALLSDNNNNDKSINSVVSLTNFGIWAPYPLPLESIKNITEQKNAINAILNQGYNEYYFPMIDFKSKAARSMAENLLQSVNGTKLKIIIILLPPSEVRAKGNFNWNAWIKYLNSLKTKYPSSLDGFVIDDFNLFNDSAHATKVDGNNHHGHRNGHGHNYDDRGGNKKKAPKELLILCLNQNLKKHCRKEEKTFTFTPFFTLKESRQMM